MSEWKIVKNKGAGAFRLIANKDHGAVAVFLSTSFRPEGAHQGIACIGWPIMSEGDCEDFFDVWRNQLDALEKQVKSELEKIKISPCTGADSAL